MNPAARWPFWATFGLAAVLGAIAAFGLAPFGYWFATVAALLGLGPLFVAAPSRSRAAWIGWAFATGYFAHALSWIVEPFLVDAQRHAWMAPFALVFMSGGLALFWALSFWMARKPGASGVSQATLLALLVSLAECARGYVLTGFPWAGLAQVWVDTPIAQLLSLIGPYGLGALTLLATLPLGAALAQRVGFRLPLAVTLGAACLALIHAATRPDVVNTDQTVRLIQPNVPQDQKWNRDYAPLHFARQIEFTAVEPRPDLIVWPETAVTARLQDAGLFLDAVSDAAQGTPVLLGILRSDGRRIYNSMIHLNAQAQVQDIYDKHHLTPFGEYVPFGNLMARFGIHGLASNAGKGFSAGAGPALMDLGELGTAQPLICYEAVFTQDVLGAPGRADFLTQITNDAWFGTRSGPYQHLAQAQMRAIEQGMPMMRAANTGVSAMIDPLGQITKALPLGEAGFVDAVLPAPLERTVYARIGDYPVFLVLVAMAALLWRNARRVGA
ncbi:MULTISPECIES: apolipoprotein N-acyltransferase [unclassified Ruegeria]|uniref:apolipoprotein N-acyltransferase n=1 Tax=unclassified Ruegeria TaxID=2625375 RepID=UPI001ADAF686|nr:MULTISPECIES: apolipoprotein N-acyltransferase [unclassified Ruegeria]MBO9409955.1 apolipoprotein N-acyltransferase [Ruegeria sp. R8_1]MBO9414826.1 apolipoprotein N-acyltransferase [Ruegeria sp. R8_2]